MYVINNSFVGAEPWTLVASQPRQDPWLKSNGTSNKTDNLMYWHTKLVTLFIHGYWGWISPH